MCAHKDMNFFDVYFVCKKNETAERYSNFNDVLFAITIMKATIKNQVVASIADES